MDFSQFTINNLGVTDLNKVIFDAVFKYSDLFNTCTAINGVKNGEKADYVDKLSDTGWAGRACNPTYKTPSITGREKTWALGDWSMPLVLCYKELESTIAQWSLKTGTPRENLTGTDYWNKIFMPLLKDAIERMYWRMAWFGDTNAKLASAGGVLTAGTDTSLFKMADGLWKRVFAASSTNKTVISANAATTYATQVSGLRANGVAVALVESILADANSLIDGGLLFVTKSINDALQKDYRREFKQTMPYMTVADGVQINTFDGVGIVVVPEWDTIIRQYEDDGTKWNNPHRAIFVNPDNLMVGTSDTSLFAEMSIGFDEKDRQNYIYAASNIGTLVNNDALLQAAY